MGLLFFGGGGSVHYGWVGVDGGVLPRFTISFVTSLFVSCWNGLFHIAKYSQSQFQMLSSLSVFSPEFSGFQKCQKLSKLFLLWCI